MKLYSPLTFPQYYFLDSTNQILGHFVNKITFFSKNIYYTKNLLIIIIKINLLKLNNFKKQNIKYYKPTNRPGNLKSNFLYKIYNLLPKRILEISILGMLPKNKQRFYFLNNIYIFQNIPSFI